MKKLMTGALVAVSALTVGAPASADPANCVPLAQIARADGYHYDYIGAQDAVTLSRGMLTILVRPGDPLYDLGDRSVSVDGPVPESRHGDIYVSQILAKRFKALAHGYAARTIPAAMRPKMTMAPPVMEAPHMAAPTRISSLTLAQSDGTSAIDVTGKGTPNSYVSLTLTAMLSKDVPRVTLSRHNAETGSDGYFSMKIPVASVFYTGSIIEVNAVPAISGENFKPTRATIVMKPIFAKSLIPADDEKSK